MEYAMLIITGLTMYIVSVTVRVWVRRIALVLLVICIMLGINYIAQHHA